MAKLSRRNAIIGGVVVAGGAIAMSRSSDESGPRNPYFLEMQKALIDAKIAQPTLVVDRKRLNANIDQVIGDLPQGMAYRIVAKSLPSLDLLSHVRQRSGTDRLMTFNLPMLLALSESMPDASQLLGKPLPAQAAKNYFEQLPQEHAEAKDQIEWLVDTPERLDQYAAIAEAAGASLKINIELDAGQGNRLNVHCRIAAFMQASSHAAERRFCGRLILPGARRSRFIAA